VESAADFKARLIRRTGLSPDAVGAAWPEWWSKDAESSASANAELRFSLARKLGLDPRSLLNSEDEPRFIWEDTTRFKGFTGKERGERPVIASFGTALSRMLLEAAPSNQGLQATSAAELRSALLAISPFVGLRELLSCAWAFGIPVIHLRVYPLSAKRMSAMSVRVGDRYAIMLARDAVYPAPVAFYLAHELGHILLGHLTEGTAIVDMELLQDAGDEKDAEEMQADAFALELLTGRPRPELVVQGEGRGARQLAREAMRVGSMEHIEPGTVAMAFGHSTGSWSTAISSLAHIYDRQIDVWRVINQLANTQLIWSELQDESQNFLRAVMGGTHG
jgi:hypothetical protein